MNLCLADITDLPGVNVGDEVVLMGRQDNPDDKSVSEITADDIAHWFETINYEVLCLFGSRNRRIYLDSVA